MPKHCIRPGECVSSIATATGLDPTKIWDDPGNKPLRELGRDMNVLAAGDELEVPNVRQKEERVATGAAHDFVVRLPKALLRIHLVDDEPLEDEPYVISSRRITIEGKTDRDGLIEEMIPGDLMSATLTLPERDEEYVIELGALAPHDSWLGAAQRLYNLGFACEESHEPTPGLRRALFEFQQSRNLELTRELDETTAQALKEAHGC